MQIVKLLLSIPKRLALFLIFLYQKYISYILHTIIPFSGCRFSPTCSEYSKISILRFGLYKGLLLTIWRLSRCQPFNPGGIDLVPEKFSYKLLLKRYPNKTDE